MKAIMLILVSIVILWGCEWKNSTGPYTDYRINSRDSY